ncbi:hypothetical protein IDVR_22250 [Intrasporangium sp. DVR]
MLGLLVGLAVGLAGGLLTGVFTGFVVDGAGVLVGLVAGVVTGAVLDALEVEAGGPSAPGPAGTAGPQAVAVSVRAAKAMTVRVCRAVPRGSA